MGQLVKNPPVMWETWGRSLGWEDTLEKGKATHTSILAWRIPWAVQSWGHKETDTTEWLSLSFKIDWFGLLAVQGLSRVFSSTTIQKHQFFGAQPLYDPTLTSLCDCRKNHSLSIHKWSNVQAIVQAMYKQLYKQSYYVHYGAFFLHLAI